MTADNFRAPDGLVHLYRHFLENGMISDIGCGDEKLLLKTGREILASAISDEDWEEWVPEAARTLVRSHRDS